MEPIRSMTDQQFAAIRDQQLALVSTFFDGSLLVRDQAGALWEMAADGETLPHVVRDRHRVDLADLPTED